MNDMTPFNKDLAMGHFARALMGVEQSKEWLTMQKVATTVSNSGGGFLVPF
jgi:hypothetical protein